MLILLVVLAVWLIHELRAAHPPGRAEKPRCSRISCAARCGVRLPRSRARQADGLLFCGEEHARLGAGNR